MMNMEVMMGKFRNVIHGLRPVLVLVLIQIVMVAIVIMYKLAAQDGMPMKVLTFYRYVLALATIAPIAFFLERKRRPKLTWTVAMQAFTIALFGGSITQNLYAEALILTSATFATAMGNIVPAITFILAIFFRFEKLSLNSPVGKAKLVGTLTSITGAMILTIYKGIEIKLWSTNIDLLHKNEQHGHVSATHHQHIDHRPVLGTLLAIASCFSAAIGLIITTKIGVKYPCQFSCTALVCIFGSLQTFVFALIFEKDWSQWKLGYDVRLLTTLFAGIASGFAAPLSLWCVQMRGPLFVSIFNPLMLVLVAIASSLFLSEKLYLGSVLGAAIIVCGLYLVIWGKSKEIKTVNNLIPTKSIEACNITTPAKVDETKSVTPINPLVVSPNILPPIILSSDDADENKNEIERSEEP